MTARVLITEGRHYDVTAAGCWEWKLRRTPDGYGMAAHGQMAHRRAYIEAGHDLPAGQPLDHLCRNRACVNPAHLEQVTVGENTRRGLAARGLLDRTECANGHSMIDAYVDPSTGKRSCRTCRRTWARDWARRNARTAA